MDERDREWVIRHLRPLVGLERAGSAARRTRSEAFAAWRRFFEAMAEEGPTVLVFEDIHWADDALLDFIDLLADRAGGGAAADRLHRPARAVRAAAVTGVVASRTRARSR